MDGALVYDTTDDTREAVVYAIGTCFICERIFSYHPNFVPSLRIDPQTRHPDPNGVREPICQECILMGNEKRKELGLTPHVIDPRAYKAAPESTVNFHDTDAAQPARRPVYTPPPWERPRECVNECKDFTECIRRPECGVNQW